MEFVAQNLDFRFADDYDIADIVSFVNTSSEIETLEGGEFQFRKKGSLKVTLPEVEADFSSQSTKWIVLETAVDEQVVGAARLNVDRTTQLAVVDVLCSTGDSAQSREYVLKLLLQKIDLISYNMHVRKLMVPIPQWRSDLEAVLVASDYVELSGHVWPTEKEIQLTKATMVLEFHKSLRAQPERSTNAGITAAGAPTADAAPVSPAPADTGAAVSTSVSSVTTSATPIIRTISVAQDSTTFTLDDLDLGNFNVIGAATTARGDPVSGSPSGAAVSATISTVADGSVSALPNENMQQLMRSLFSALHSEYKDDSAKPTTEDAK